MNAMILAAGEGTRFRPHTLIKPKPAIPFLNVPLAMYSVSLLNSLNIDRMIVNTFHLPNQIVDLFRSQPLPTKNLFFSDETPQILGSGGGLKKAEKHFDLSTPIIVMNGDEVILPANDDFLAKALKAHLERNNMATYLVIEHPEVGKKFGGLWVNNKNEILAIGKQAPDPHSKAYHFIGIAIYSKKIFFYLPDGKSHIFKDGIMPALAKKEKVEVFPVDAKWFETGNLGDYLSASRECLQLIKAGVQEGLFLQNILKTYSPQSILNGNILSASPELSDVDVSDFAIIGKNVHVPAGAKIQASVIDSNCTLQTMSLNEELILQS